MAAPVVVETTVYRVTNESTVTQLLNATTVTTDAASLVPAGPLNETTVLKQINETYIGSPFGVFIMTAINAGIGAGMALIAALAQKVVGQARGISGGVAASALLPKKFASVSTVSGGVMTAIVIHSQTLDSGISAHPVSDGSVSD